MTYENCDCIQYSDYSQWQSCLPKCNIVQLYQGVDLNTGHLHTCTTLRNYTPTTTYTKCYCVCSLHIRYTDMKLPSAYLGLGQGLSLHLQLVAAANAERRTTATLLQTTLFQCIKHVLVVHSRKGAVGTVKRTGEVLLWITQWVSLTCVINSCRREHSRQSDGAHSFTQ